MQALNLRNGVLSHHLNKQEKKSVIKVERTPRVARFYPLGITDFEAVISKRLRKETPRRILQLLLDTEKINYIQELLKLLDLHQKPNFQFKINIKEISDTFDKD